MSAIKKTVCIDYRLVPEEIRKRAYGHPSKTIKL